MNPSTSRRFFLCQLPLWASALAAATARPAEVPTSLDQARERMKTNLRAIEQLKTEGKVGENNKGYLEARSHLTEKEATLVKQENADRKFVYETLAQRAGVSVEEIQRTRAEQIRRRSAPGLWLQAPDGRWYRKTEPASE